MKTWMATAGAGVGAFAFSVVISAQAMQVTPVPGRTTPLAGGMAGEAPTGTGPAMKSDCANNGWQNYPNQGFKSQKACESYVRKHASKKGSTRTMSHAQAPGTTPSSSGAGSMAPTPQPPR